MSTWLASTTYCKVLINHQSVLNDTVQILYYSFSKLILASPLHMFVAITKLLASYIISY